MTGRQEFVGCLIGDAYDFSFGYRAADGAQSLQEQVGNTTTKVDGVGDEAFVQKSEYAMVVGARFGEDEILVRNDSLGNSDPAVRVDEQTTLAVLKEIGKNLPEDLKASVTPVELGSGCLAADSTEVEALVGSVVLARGGIVGEATNCDYLGEGGSTIHLSRSKVSNAADFFGDDSSDRAEIAGVVKAEIRESPEDEVVELTIQPTQNELAFVTASRGVGTSDDKAERKVTKKDTLAMAAAFLEGTK